MDPWECLNSPELSLSLDSSTIKVLANWSSFKRLHSLSIAGNSLAFEILMKMNWQEMMEPANDEDLSWYIGRYPDTSGFSVKEWHCKWIETALGGTNVVRKFVIFLKEIRVGNSKILMEMWEEMRRNRGDEESQRGKLRILMEMGEKMTWNRGDDGIRKGDDGIRKGDDGIRGIDENQNKESRGNDEFRGNDEIRGKQTLEIHGNDGICGNDKKYRNDQSHGNQNPKTHGNDEDQSRDDADSQLFADLLNSSGKFADSLISAVLNSEMNLTWVFRRVDDRLERVARILLARKVLRPTVLIKILQEINVDESFFLRFATVWGDRMFVQQSDFQRHAQISAVIRFCLVRFKSNIPTEAANRIVHGVQEHLECNVEEKRQLGMIVAELFSKCYLVGLDGVVESLDFGLDRSQVHDEYAAFDSFDEGSNSVVTTLPANIEKPSRSLTAETFQLDDDPDAAIVGWPWKRPLYVTAPPSEQPNQPDGGDDDVCSLDPYDLQDDPQEGLLVRPKYLSQIPGMLLSSTFDAWRTALQDLPTLVRAKRSQPDTRRRAPRLAATLLELDNKFGLDNFDELRSNALVALITCAPKETAPKLARLAYSRDLTIGLKLVALHCLVEGARVLADGLLDEFGGDYVDVEEVISNVSLLKINAVGTVKRKSRALLDAGGGRTSKKCPGGLRRNDLAPIAYEAFFSPLIRRVADFEHEPILLSKVLTCLGFVLERSRHAGGGALKMAESLMSIMMWTRYRLEPEIRRSTLFALSAVFSVSPELFMEWREWVELVAINDPDDLCRNMASSLLQPLVSYDLLFHEANVVCSSNNPLLL